MSNKKLRHFLRVLDLNKDEILRILEGGFRLKRQKKAGIQPFPATGKSLGLLFEKPSTRTRVSFEAAMFNLGGQVTFMSSRDLQLTRGEPIKDTARVLSRYLDCVVIRTFGQAVVEEFAKWSTIPVINGLTDEHHPCQVLSDIMTVIECKGHNVEDLKIAWVGDGNNVCHSWIELSARLGFELKIACPKGFEPDETILAQAKDEGARVTISDDPFSAVSDADVINTDVWASMGQEDELEKRKQIFMPYQVNNELISKAPNDAIVLHCLPAHRGEEITDDVIESPQAPVWDQAENKMHLHASILFWALELKDGV
ncbi:Ornithine carbamoyltransferase [Dissulfuribacter thermophilus]|uniref:Ornithine carbamoyltransferase n=1 Tax=Dissulfuribacter thermophilus TaxID=1156395 RepID=A0A1B9F7P1_9BACT|nr:ornithine carbamoyltransferase [Dissulfuribacter thermophilus]OCC15864.1 Ornithine carbamoyltransferase [Dissulfuribacter thermophilus]